MVDSPLIENKEGFHTRDIYSEDGVSVGSELILDENGLPIPLSICLCFAHEPGECCCNTTSWDNYRYD